MTHSQILKGANLLVLLTHKPKPAPTTVPADTHPIRQNMDIRKKLINGDDLSQATTVPAGTPLPTTTPLPGDNLNFPKMASSMEETYYKRRHRLLKLFPALAGALYGGLAGATDGHISGLHGGEDHTLAEGLAGAAIGGGLGYGAGALASKAYDYVGVQPFTRPVTMVPSPSQFKNAEAALQLPKMAGMAAYHPDIQTPGDAVDNVSELKQISDLLQKHPERLAPAKDVLNNTSMTIPKGVVNGVGGTAIGAGVGSLASHLFDGPEETLEDHKRNEGHHRLGAVAGGALGLYLASHKDLANSGIMDSIRQKLAI